MVPLARYISSSVFSCVDLLICLYPSWTASPGLSTNAAVIDSASEFLKGNECWEYIQAWH